MRDADIRAALRRHLDLEHSDDGTRVVEELGLSQGLVRIDVVAINGSLVGYEIKSDRDTLARLDEQQRIYSQVFDQVTIVTHVDHLAHVRERVPRWWGIIEAADQGVGVELIPRRQPRRNPRRDAYALVQLLWHDEVLSVLDRRGIATGIRHKPRRFAWQRAAERITLRELAEEVREIIKHRPVDWRQRQTRAAARPGSNGDSCLPSSM
jgi:hypothetical protein